MVTSRFRADLLDTSGRKENMRIAKLSGSATKNEMASGLMVTIPSRLFLYTSTEWSSRLRPSGIPAALRRSLNLGTMPVE